MTGARPEGEAMERWGSIVRSVPLFTELDDAMLHRVAEASETLRFGPGDALMVEGEVGDRSYLVVEGSVDVFVRRRGDTPLRRFGPGDVFGEISLIVGGKRAATVRAVEPTTVLALSRERARALHQAHPSAMAPLVARLDRMLHRRMRLLRLVNMLPKLFGEPTPELIARIEEKIEWRRLASGERLFAKGDPPDAAYIVLLGRLEAELDSVEAVIMPGEWAGEMALLSNEPRSATVYATRDTELARLSTEAFDDLVIRHPTAMRRLTQLIVQRLQQQLSNPIRTLRPVRSLALVPAHPDVDLEGFAAMLRRELSRHGSVAWLTEATVDQEFGVPGIARAPADHPGRMRLVPWLLKLEDQHDYVVYDTGGQWSEWSERAVRQADHVLTVVDTGRRPGLGDNERRLAAFREGGHTARHSLVLWHRPHEQEYRRTREWLDLRRVDAHYHVRRNHRNDVARLARILTGRAVSLVIGGGGARSCAGIGVIRAMRELGIPIDAVAGTSMGAVIGAALAAGYSTDQMLAEYGTYTSAVFDATLPVVSLLSAERINRSHHKLLGAVEIEDLALPFFCVSTNLTRGRLTVHDRGPTDVAVRASMSIPGVFPPTEIDGDLAVDGGLFNNVPADIMAERIGGSIIAIDVIPDVDGTVQGRLPRTVSGWKVLAKRLNPLADRDDSEPNIINILMRSVNMGSVSLSKSSAMHDVTAVFLRPTVRQWNVFAFHASRSIASQGYDGSIEPLRAWWETAEQRRT